MWCVEAEDMHYGVLAERVRYFKEDKEGVASMCRAMEEMRNKAAEQVTFRAKVDDAIQIMKSFKVTAQEALRVLQVPEAEYPRYLAAIG